MKNDKRMTGELNIDSQMPMANLPLGGRIEKGSNGVPRSPINGTPKKMNLANGRDCKGESPRKGKKNHGK